LMGGGAGGGGIGVGGGLSQEKLSALEKLKAELEAREKE
jgi:hypothetical protein